MRANSILKCIFLIIIGWIFTMVINCPGLKGQEIESVCPEIVRLPVEGGIVRVMVNVKNAPENFVLKFAAGGLVRAFLANILNYRIVGNMIELNVGPASWSLFGVGDQLQFYTNAGMVRFELSQPRPQVSGGFIRDPIPGNNVVFTHPVSAITVLEEASGMPAEFDNYTYFWEVKRFNEQAWRRVPGATNRGSVTLPVEGYNVTMVRRGVNTSNGVLYSNVVYYIPISYKTINEIQLHASSTTILPGTEISISPDVLLGERGNISYQWVMWTSDNTWAIIEGADKESLTLPGIRQNVSVQRLATIDEGTIPSKVFNFNYIDMSQIRITADKDHVSHFMPFRLESEYEIGTGAVFEWQKKEVGTTVWTRLDGETRSGLNYSGLLKDTYFRLVTTLEGEVYHSNEILIHHDNIGGGLIRGAVPIITSGGYFSISSELPEGMDLGNHYTWEKRNQGNDWTVIDGATGSTYSASGLTGNTWFRRKIVIASREYYSNEVLVVVSPGPCMVTTTYLDTVVMSEPTRAVTDVTYYDGACREIQYTMVNGSPVGNGDMITPVYQGPYNGKEREYLPYAQQDNDGSLVSDTPFASTRWTYLETGERPYAFKKVIYDGSPLERQKKITGPGKNWHEADKGMTITYGTNGEGHVRLYRVESNGSIRKDGNYTPGALHKQTVEDEDGRVTETFTGRDGQTVLSVNVNGSERYETYSVYDRYGLLRYVLSPEASARVGETATSTTPVIRDYAYYYEYDGWSRMVLKQLPGCDPVYMVYDKRDRLVMSQDGKQRAEDAKKWSYSLYDGQNRVVETGEVVLASPATHAVLQSAASGSDNYIPVGSRSPLQYTLYDTYEAMANLPVLPFLSTAGYAPVYHKGVTGLVTSVKTRVLGTNTWLTTTTYYDDRCRVIQTVSDNLQGGTSRMNIAYNFTGGVVKQRESHTIGAQPADVLERENTLDDRGRLLAVTTRLNGGPPVTGSLGYDVVGRLVTRTRGVVTETMTCNPRGWLTGKESTPFKMKLRYESPAGGADTCWNGNISEWEWQHGTSAAVMYGLVYDGVNRLKEAFQKQKSGTAWSTLAGSYLEKGITYDRNGNIKTLQRTANGTTVDNLVYTYTGNRLTSLTENIRTAPSNDVYAPGTALTGTYAYDKNGNMITDSRKVLNFTSNVLNLLSEVKTGSTLKAKYSYLADGTKLRVRDGVTESGANGFDYLGSLTYKKSSAGLQLEMASFGDGVIRVTGPNSTRQEVNYFLTDHLGSVRVIVDGNGVVKERDDYYPFGARHVRSDYPQLAANRFKYNGKELQVTGDLGYLDHGARMYDSGLGRWFCVDPFQESFVSLSPYNYCSGNPLIFIDPSGALITHYVDADYNVILQTDDGSDDVVVVPASRRDEFDKEVAWYSASGYMNTFAWNQSWKDDLGLADFQFSEEAVTALNQFNSKWSRNSAARFLLNPTFKNALRMSFSEALSQWTNPELVAGGISSGVIGLQAMKGFARNRAVIAPRYNSVETLIEGAGNFTRVKAGLQGFVKGNGEIIFNSLIKNAIKQSNGTYLLRDGTVLFKHRSTTTGVYTIDINRAGKVYKIRIE